MKYIFLILTFLLHVQVFLSLKFLDNPGMIVAIFISSLLIGLFLKSAQFKLSHQKIYAIGWGIFYASLACLVMVAGLYLFLSA